MIGVVLVDDHPVVLAGLRGLLAGDPELTVVGAATTAHDAATLDPEVAPDVCVVDLNLPDGDGIELAAALKERWPGAKALLLTLDADPATVLRGLGAGLDGYLLKDTDPLALCAAIRSVARGSVVLGRGASAPLVTAAQSAGDPASLVALTSRQRELLALMAEGLGVHQVASRLYLAPKTVRNRMTDLIRSLGVESREQAVALARAHGLGTSAGTDGGR